jgi:hypothetical protein
LTERKAAANAADGWSDSVQRQIDRTRLTVEQFIAEHPGICLGAAVVMGIAVGWWVKRR